MTDHCVRPAREHRGTPATLGIEVRVPNRVDAAMDVVQTADPEPVMDRVLADPRAYELIRGHDAVLACRYFRDHPVR